MPSVVTEHVEKYASVICLASALSLTTYYLVIARLILNYKQISYTTCWIEYPDIAPTLRAKGVSPNSSFTAPWEYTLPAIQLTNGETIMESLAIARSLELHHPKFSLLLDSIYLPRVNIVFDKIYIVLSSMYLTSVPQLLNARSAEYFRHDRERTLNKSLEQIEAELQRPRQDQQIHNAMTPYVHELAAMFQENDAGPFLLGKVVCYADFVVIAWMRFYEDVGYLDRFLTADPGPLRLLYEAAAAWLSRDDR